MPCRAAILHIVADVEGVGFVILYVLARYLQLFPEIIHRHLWDDDLHLVILVMARARNGQRRRHALQRTRGGHEIGPRGHFLDCRWGYALTRD